METCRVQKHLIENITWIGDTDFEYAVCMSANNVLSDIPHKIDRINFESYVKINGFAMVVKFKLFDFGPEIWSS